MDDDYEEEKRLRRIEIMNERDVAIDNLIRRVEKMETIVALIQRQLKAVSKS